MNTFSAKSCTIDNDRPSFARGVSNLPCKINQRVLDNLIIQTWLILVSNHLKYKLIKNTKSSSYRYTIAVNKTEADEASTII